MFIVSIQVRIYEEEKTKSQSYKSFRQQYSIFILPLKRFRSESMEIE